MNNNIINQGLSIDEKLMIFIIDFLINENKSINYIRETLKRYGFPTDSGFETLNEFINQYFSYSWDSKIESWVPNNEIQINIFHAKNVTKFINYINNDKKTIAYGDYIPYRTLRIPPGANIPKIDMLEMAVSTLPEEKTINLNSNDAATLLKEIAKIESKLNEISRVVNKISEYIVGK